MIHSDDIFEKEKEFILSTYKRTPLNISHGDGVYLYTKDGKRYLDFFSGLAVNALGYGNEKIIQAIENQIKKYIHLSNYYITSPQVDLAEQLVKYSGLSKVFFTNSGTEAVEASIKLIRKFHGPGKKIITFSNAFHGRTYGALSLGGREKYKQYFSPLLSNIIQLEFNNVEQLKSNIDSNIAAVFIEFIQGEGGVQVASDEFIETINLLNIKNDFILVADEIQTGIGRTGKEFAYNHFDVTPDIILVAKAIGGGLPLGALITSQKYSGVFNYGDHGSTFGGNPVACSAGLVVIDEVLNNGLVNKVKENGDFFLNQLQEISKSNQIIIREVRGMGYLLGVELRQPCTKIIEEFRAREILVNCTAENVIRILPPLIATKKHIQYFLENFNEILTQIS